MLGHCFGPVCCYSRLDVVSWCLWDSLVSGRWSGLQMGVVVMALIVGTCRVCCRVPKGVFSFLSMVCFETVLVW